MFFISFFKYILYLVLLTLSINVSIFRALRATKATKIERYRSYSSESDSSERDFSENRRSISLYDAVKFGLYSEGKRYVRDEDDPNFKDGSLLYLSIFYGRFDITKLLLEQKIFVQWKNDYGWTSLHYAIDMGYLGIAKLLIRYGADLYVKNSNGHTVADIARNRGFEEIEALIKEKRREKMGCLGFLKSLFFKRKEV